MEKAPDRGIHGRIAALIIYLIALGAAYGAGHWWLSGGQLGTFQSIMHWLALASLVVLAAGERLGRWTHQMLEMANGWLLRNPGRAALLLVAFMLAYFTFWSGVSFLRHYSFRSSYDLAIMDQVVWNTAQGRFFARSFEVMHDFADHVRPYLGLLSLPYLVFPSPYVLLAFQSLALALTAWPLYRLARRKFDSPSIALIAALCALAFPALGFLNRYDFHIEVVSIPLLVAAYERLDAGDLKRASLFMAATLLAKENLGLTVAALGIVAGLTYKRWLFGLAWAGIGVTYSAAALLVVIPAFRGAPSDTLERYAWLGVTPLEMLQTLLLQPGFVLQKSFDSENLVALLQLLAPMAFLPLLALPALVPALPTLVYNFLAEWPAKQGIYQHYMAPVIPFILIAAVLGLKRMSASNWAARFLRVDPAGSAQRGRLLGLGVAMMLLATLASWVYQTPIRGRYLWLWRSAPRAVAVNEKAPLAAVSEKGRTAVLPTNNAAIREGLRHVPAGVSLLTTGNYAPHLSQRAQIEMIPFAPVAAFDPEPEAIFLNLRDQRWWKCEDYADNLKAAAKSNFGVVFYGDDVVLLQKDQGDRKKLRELLDGGMPC